MDVTSKQFIPLTNLALADTSLQKSISTLGKRLETGRTLAAERLPEFETLRDEARDIKDHTIAHLDLYLEAFECQVTAKGGTVHFAKDGQDARDIILGICQAAGGTRVTKSKSMVTEEIDLVPFLEHAGIEAVETDLGEYIIQLRNERPSHIVAPAVHLNKDQVSDTFHEHHQALGYNARLTERADLVHEARMVLREKFLGADIGISGANFLIAETGTVVLVTNEGNAELTTGLPDTHIVVTGIEKLVPTLEDASTFVRLLARSAVGADISAYTSFITGPKREEDADGPANFHVVLVDNGRSEMVGTEFQEMLRCIRCSACLNHCPVYLSVGGHAYGSVYNGPMGAVLTPQFAKLENARHLPNASTFCGRCEEVCPVRIPLPKLMRFWRNREAEQGLSQRGIRWGLGAWNWLGLHPGLYRLATRVAVRILRAWPGKGPILKLPGIAGNWTQDRNFPRGEGKTFLEMWSQRNG